MMGANDSRKAVVIVVELCKSTNCLLFFDAATARATINEGLIVAASSMLLSHAEELIILVESLGRNLLA